MIRKRNRATDSDAYRANNQSSRGTRWAVKQREIRAQTLSAR
jgi:hypothetical protein